MNIAFSDVVVNSEHALTCQCCLSCSHAEGHYYLLQFLVLSDFLKNGHVFLSNISKGSLITNGSDCVYVCVVFEKYVSLTENELKTKLTSPDGK